MSYRFLWKGYSIKYLTRTLKKNGGRNRVGHTTIFHRGGGSKQKFKFINFNSLQNFFNAKSSSTNSLVLAIIRRFEYDSNRRCFLALVCSQFNELGYLLAQENMYVGQVISYTKSFLTVPEVGNTTILKNFNLGHFVSNISKKPGGYAIFTRAAGAKSLLVKKYPNSIVLKLQSDQLKIFNSKCIATLGSISNSENKLKKFTKAGEIRWLGKRSVTRGVAMNPVDHPHGGGEGKTSGGRCSVSPWGILTKGYPTVRGKKRKLKLQ